MRGYQEGYMNAVRRRALQKGVPGGKGCEKICVGGRGVNENS